MRLVWKIEEVRYIPLKFQKYCIIGIICDFTEMIFWNFTSWKFYYYNRHHTNGDTKDGDLKQWIWHLYLTIKRNSRRTICDHHEKDLQELYCFYLQAYFFWLTWLEPRVRRYHKCQRQSEDDGAIYHDWKYQRLHLFISIIKAERSATPLSIARSVSVCCDRSDKSTEN